MTRIAGQRRGEAYPSPPRAPSGGGGAIAQIGFDNSVEGVQYANAGIAGPILRAADTPLSVTLVNFTPGNTILWFISMRTRDGIFSGPVGYSFDVVPTLNLGSGVQAVDTPSGEVPSYTIPAPIAAAVFPTVWPPHVTMSFYKPTPEELLQDPVVSGLIRVSPDAPDAVLAVFKGGAMLCAIEIAGDFIVDQGTSFDPDTITTSKRRTSQQGIP